MSASPVRCNINNWGRIATDSNQIENVQRIWTILARSLRHPLGLDGRITNLGEMVVVRKEQGQDGADPKEVLDLERIEIGVVSRLVVVEHEVYDVSGGTDEEELERSEV